MSSERPFNNYILLNIFRLEHGVTLRFHTVFHSSWYFLRSLTVSVSIFTPKRGPIKSPMAHIQEFFQDQVTHVYMRIDKIFLLWKNQRILMARNKVMFKKLLFLPVLGHFLTPRKATEDFLRKRFEQHPANMIT